MREYAGYSFITADLRLKLQHQAGPGQLYHVWCFRFDEDPLHKYQTIPLENNFVKKKLKTKTEPELEGEEEKSINYAYHPIIDFFSQS